MTAAADERLRSHRDFTVLFVGATLSRLATEMHSVAIVLFVLAKTGSAHIAGLTIAAATLPTVVTGPLVGAWLDRSKWRRAAFVISPLILAVAMVWFLLVADHAPGGLFVLIGFVAGLPSPVRTGGFSGLIPTVVPEPVLPKAYGAEAASYNLAGIAGPALAGAVAGAFGASWAVVATGAMALAACMVVIQVPIQPSVASDQQPMRESLRAGFGLLWRSRPLRTVTVATTIGQGWFGLMVVAYPLLAHQLGHARAAGGLLFSVFAVGALIGSICYTRIAGRVSDQMVAMTMFGFVGAAFGGLAAAPSLVVAVLFAGIAGVFDGPMLAATLNLRQRLSPDVLRTQVFTTAASLKIGSFALGSALAGPAASAVGARGMLALVGAGQVIAVVCGVAVAGRRKPPSPLSLTQAEIGS